MTNRVGFDLSTVVADRFQQLLDLGQETYISKLATSATANQHPISHTDVKDRGREFDVTKVSRALFRSLLTCLAVVLAVDGTQAGVIHTFGSRAMALFIL